MYNGGKMKIEVDIDVANEVVAQSLLESLETQLMFAKRYKNQSLNTMGGGHLKEYYDKCFTECREDYRALVRAHNYYTTPSEHITEEEL
jgi:hypothetical protein